MLSDDEKNRIRLEEEEKLQARARVQDELARQRAARSFRAQVAAELTGASPTRRRIVLIAVSGLVVAGLIALTVFWLSAARPDVPSSPTDGTGGITDAALIERCKNEVRGRLGDGQAEFPSDADAFEQVSASSDGKRWDGFAICPLLPGRPRVDFSCRYTPQNDAVELEIIKP